MGIMQVLYSIKGVFNRLTGKVAPTVYMEETEQHFEQLFGVRDESEHTVFHELASEYVHIDVHILHPTDERPFYVLFTTGMSDLPMTLPDDAQWDFKKIHERAELFCLMPREWKPDGKLTKEERERYLWIISALKTAARYPHSCKTWLGSGHTLQYNEENVPFADNTKLSSAVFIQLDYKDFGGKYDDGFNGFTAKDNSYINLLCFVPLYEDEMNFKLENSADNLFMRLFGDTVKEFSQLVIDSDRENVCMNRSI